MRFLKIITLGLLVIMVLAAVALFFLAQKEKPAQVNYGMSFNTMYARELGLDWKETYDAILDDLGVRRLRLAAHWNMVEPVEGEYNFSELDYQLDKAQSVGAEVIFAVGRRLPRWPECHVPSWATNIELEKRNEAQILYMTKVIERYKNNPAVKYWQVENEPFLQAFAFEQCGDLDVDFLEREIALVRSLDPNRPILITDSGNLGTWAGAYKRGDIFGTSVYVHFWNPELGQFKTFLPAWFYRAKENLMALLYGRRPVFLIELSAEPWLVEPITEVPLSVQFSRMDLEKFKDILLYAEATHFENQYLWGAEWWYWLKQNGQAEFWGFGKTLYLKDNI